MDDDHIVLINTFSVEPDAADRLLAALADATETVIKDMPGFISATFLVSLDRTKVVNYAAWRSFGDFQAMTQDAHAKPHMEACAAIARGFEPVLYRVASAHAA